MVVFPAPTTPMMMTIMLDCMAVYFLEYFFCAAVRPFSTVKVPSFPADTLRNFPSQFSLTLAMRSASML